MSIKLSPKHGVNPSMMQCFACMKDFGLVLVGRLPADAEAPRRMTRPGWFCDECKGFMAQGVIFISVRDGEKGDNPYRSGHFAVVKTHAVEAWPDGELKAHVLRARLCFIEDKFWETVGGYR
jgi:hypothetical protein